MRRQKQLQKRHDAADDETEKRQLAEDLSVAEIDVLYPQYFPFLEAYVSLYPPSSKKGESAEVNDSKGKDEDKDADTDAPRFSRGPRPPMWDTIMRAYKSGGIPALEAIRDRQPDKGDRKTKTDKVSSNAARGTKDDKTGKKNKELKKTEEEPDSDDGGFFEDT